MALSRDQYDHIMRGYAQTRDRHLRQRQQRREEVYLRVPALRELDSEVPAMAADRLRARLTGTGDAQAQEAARRSVEDAARRRRELLTENGWPADYLDLTYDCPYCRDTGYVNGEKCRCLKRREVELLYDQSHLQAQMKEARFDRLSEHYYEGEDLTNFRRALRSSLQFVRTFGTDAACPGLLFYGSTGVGKSSLSACIAGELLDRGFSVLYFSAATLFDRLSGYGYDARERDEFRVFTGDLYTCDLLIIDDLGTELTNQYVSAQLFACLSERLLRRKSTVISTNLPLKELQKRYSDRTFSRILDSYLLCRMTGRDIRVLRRRERSAAPPS